jgi:hypothetical protein
VLGTSGDIELHRDCADSEAISDDDYVVTMGRAATSRSKSNAELPTLTSVDAACRPLQAVQCLPSTACRLLPAVYCLQSTACRLLPAVYCLPSTASRLLPPVSCLPSTTSLLSSAACGLPDSAERSIRGGSRGASALHFDGSE